ncbi:MAG: branched-chain amino acid ABC transporter substrate-binding protein [Desulforhopalus sp.]|nr:branched-chain amino acid ABC transporter substrate-binding protein [Desulforhopalus sp.]
MNNRGKILPFLQGCILVIPLLLLGCSQEKQPFVCVDAIGCVSLSGNEPIKIGVIQALSGRVAPLGKEQLYGLELALDFWQGKVAGHSVEIQTEDTGCSSEGGANAALKIVADPKTVAIFGTTCSGSATTAAKVMADAGLTMISGNNSAPFLTSIDGKRGPHWHPGYFRTANNEEIAGKAAATYAYTVLGIHNAATINDGDIYTKGLTEGFKKVFSALGGTIVLDTAINKGDREMLPVLTAVANTKAQLLFFPLFQPEGNLILRKARELESLKNVLLMADGALIENSFIADMGDLAQGMYFVGPSTVESEAVKLLDVRYREKFKTTPAVNYYLRAYDAVNLLFKAIDKVAVKEPDGTLHIGRQALREALYTTRAFPGITGHLTCDEFGDCAVPIFNILQMENPGEGVAALQKNIKYTYSLSQ